MIPTKIIVHCAVTPDGQNYPIERIREDHIKNRGFKDIGYHFVIEADGELLPGRPADMDGAHCEGENHCALGVCLIGTKLFTGPQFATLKSFLTTQLSIHGIAPTEIYCHHEMASAIEEGKTCPNMDAAFLLRWYFSGRQEYISKYLYVPKKT